MPTRTVTRLTRQDGLLLFSLPPPTVVRLWKATIKDTLDVGTHAVRETPIELSRLIDILNARFGTDFTEADQLYFDQIRQAAILSDDLRQAAEANTLDKFQILFHNVLQSLVIDRMEQNEELTAKVLNDDTFQKLVSQWIGEDVYRRLRDRETAEVRA